MEKKVIFAFLSVLILFASCITPKQTNLLQDINKNYPNDDVAPIDYKIIPGDQLTLIVYTLDESIKSLFSAYISDRPTDGGGNPVSDIQTSNMANNSLSVLSSGTIRIPYIGEVYVLDMTVLEAKRIISNKFKEFSPNVSIDLSLRNRYYYVLGELGPGVQTMQNLRINIFQALAQTGNISRYGDRKNVKIIRQTATGTEVKTFDIRSKEILNSDYYYIQPNDVIYVPQRQIKFFGGISSFAEIFSFIGTLAGLGLGIWAAVDRF
ncbi:MAG: polysaccharide biosynthesis/export family protein [Dysgonomonas sp.]